MNEIEKTILTNFKSLLLQRVAMHRLVVFGSRARGDADPESDIDVLVILSGPNTPKARKHISDCAWEAGFKYGLVVSPIVVSRNNWENGPEKYSLLAKAVEEEGITV